MKNVKLMMPAMAFVMAVGLAFANKANVQTAGWVERNGMPYQLTNDPCSGAGANCRVIFSDDPTIVHDVYTDQTLQEKKQSGVNTPYLISE